MPATVAPTAAPPTAVPQPTPVPAEQPRALLGDVMDFALKGDWPGRFGFVKFKLNAGFFDGDKAYFIRTDASDKAFADANKSVQDVQAALAAGEVEEFAGTPDTHPGGFIVNCPVPVLAPNTFTG